MATNKNNDTTALSKVRYDKNNFEGYVTDMKAALRLHPDKLDTVMTKGSLNPLISRRHRDKYEAILDKDGNRKYSDTDIEERLNEIRTEGKAEVAAQKAVALRLVLPPHLPHDGEVERLPQKRPLLAQQVADRHTAAEDGDHQQDDERRRGEEAGEQLHAEL